MFAKLLAVVRAHKVLTAIVVIALAGGGYYYWQQRSAAAAKQTRYVSAAATTGTLIVNVTGTGSVASSQQVDVKPKVSGTVVRIYAKKGDMVKAGSPIIAIDATDAQKAVRDAELNLKSAQLALQKLQAPPDAVTLLQAQNAVEQSKEAALTAQTAFSQSYADGYTSIANAFLDLPNLMTGLNDVINGNELSTTQSNVDFYRDRIAAVTPNSTYADDTTRSYAAAVAQYNTTFSDFKAASAASSQDTIGSLLSETAATAQTIATVIKNDSNLVQLYQDQQNNLGRKPSSASVTQLTTLNSYTVLINKDLADLTAHLTAIDAARTSSVDAARSVADKQQQLAQLQAGATALDISADELAIQQKQNALLDAQQNLANYTVTSPLDGVVATNDLLIGSTVDTGSAVVTVIANQQLAEISLSEVDVTKVKIGQPATLTFDAIPDLSIAGKVADIDTIGTVSQGVVTYKEKVAFATQDARVKPSMTVSAAIIVNSQQNALMVPVGAVKQRNDGTSYVLVIPDTEVAAAMKAGSRGIPLSTPPVQQDVTTGLSNDESVVITSGLKDGDMVVTTTVTASAASTTAPRTTNSLFSIPGGGGRGGFGGGRIGG